MNTGCFPLEAKCQKGRTWKRVGVGGYEHAFPAIYEGHSIAGNPCFICVNAEGKSMDRSMTLTFPAEIEDWRL